MSSDLSIDSTTDDYSDFVLAPPLNYADRDWHQMIWPGPPSAHSGLKQRILEIYHSGNHVLAYQLLALYLQTHSPYDIQLAKSKKSRPNLSDAGISQNQYLIEFYDRFICEQNKVLYDAGLAKTPPPLEPISPTNYPALWAWQTYCLEHGISLSPPKNHSGGFKEFWREHKKAIIIAAAVIVVAAGVAIVIVTTAGTGTSIAIATGAGAAKSALDSYNSSDSADPKAQNISCEPIANEKIHNFAETIYATRVDTIEGPIPIIETNSISSEITPEILTSLATHWHSNLPLAPTTAIAKSIYGSPTCLENGVVLHGQQYSYSEFLRQSKQEDFFTRFLNAAESLHGAGSNYRTSPTGSISDKSRTDPTPPSDFTTRLPIPPQPGSSLTHRFFEMLGREVLGPELVADTPISKLQQSHLFTTPGKWQPTCQIGGINGINTSLDDAVGHANYIAELSSGHSINWVYNNSHGALGDLAEVFTQNYSGTSLNTASLLTENWVAFHEENKHNPKAKYLQLCHSQGAIHVRNALLNAPKEIRNRIIVVAIAPAAVVPEAICFQSFNYASKKDIVPLGELIFAKALDANEEESSPALEIALERHKELILVNPHPEAIGIDHDFRGLTFKKILQDHANDHIKCKGKYD